MDIPDYFRFDMTENALCAIDICADLAPRIEEKHSYVKWLIIATHDMLQSAMVCALSGTANIGALNEKSQKEFLKWHAASLQDPDVHYASKEFLANFDELLKRVQKPKQSSGCKGLLDLTEQQKGDLLFLHDELRNNFVHFNIGAWSIDSASVSRVLLVAYDAAEALMTGPEVSLDGIQLERMQSGLQKNRALIRTWRIAGLELP